MVSIFPATGTQGLDFLYLPKYFVLLYYMGVAAHRHTCSTAF